jgi:hypothetical protein
LLAITEYAFDVLVLETFKIDAFNLVAIYIEPTSSFLALNDKLRPNTKLAVNPQLKQ